ncbi:hypothetical protein QBC32DRAFT_21275 [Pseudoneurospora amorphoporcata]|uniref:Uncharacterized protein n=1 Tax=Pseudoneurospora amorphoporcata TaxID=241081 RepID=A0AAN6SEL4_9PEZI|nr:hypothetical protein QBC32DRAFT_21275 [Pseudoneurospora amorphoporcata]
MMIMMMPEEMIETSSTMVWASDGWFRCRDELSSLTVLSLFVLRFASGSAGSWRRSFVGAAKCGECDKNPTLSDESTLVTPKSSVVLFAPIFSRYSLSAKGAQRQQVGNIVKILRCVQVQLFDVAFFSSSFAQIFPFSSTHNLCSVACCKWPEGTQYVQSKSGEVALLPSCSIQIQPVVLLAARSAVVNCSTLMHAPNILLGLQFCGSL